MAGKSNNNATLFAQKKLLNKAHTSVLKSDAQETITTNIQPAAQTTFGQSIPANPSKTLYQIQSSSAGEPGTIEYVQFNIESITGTTYDGNAVDTGAGPEPSTTGPHGYALILTGNYQALSSNTKKGNGVFDNGKVLSGTLGQLQIIPPVFSTDRPNPYSVTLYKGDPTDDTQVIALESEIDYQLDTFNGILFVQDYDASNVPLFARAFIYVGDMVDTVIANTSGGGSGDSQARYLVLEATGSLSNERVFNPTTGLSFTDGGSGGNYTLQIDNSAVATLTGSVFSGPVVANSGLSGSLQKLSDGTSYLREGLNVSIVSSSDGHITISSTAADGEPSYFTDPAAGFLNTTGSTSFAGSLGASHVTSNVGSDTFFFASGAIDSRGTSTRGTAVFGGDVVLSGTLSVNRAQAGVGSFVTITSDGKVGIGSDTPAYKLSVGGNMDLGEYLYHKNNAETFMRFESDQITFSAGDERMLTLREHGQDVVTVGGHGSNVDFQVSGSGDFNALFVDSSAGRVGMGTDSPSSILHIKEAAPTLTLQRENNSNASTINFIGQSGNAANSIIHDLSTNDLVFKTFNGSAVEEIMRVGDHYGTSVRQVTFLSGSNMAPPAMQPRSTSDIAFFVSGAIGSRETTTRGTSVFGGDLVISGTSHHLNGISGSLTALNDGSPYLRSGTGISITTGSSGAVTITGTNSATSRSKDVYTISSLTPAGQSVTVGSSNFSNGGFSQDNIDIFVNGQLLHSGSLSDVSAGSVDYFIESATSLKFSFNLEIDDLLDVVVFTVT